MTVQTPLSAEDKILNYAKQIVTLQRLACEAAVERSGLNSKAKIEYLVPTTWDNATLGIVKNSDTVINQKTPGFRIYVKVTKGKTTRRLLFASSLSRVVFRKEISSIEDIE